MTSTSSFRSAGMASACKEDVAEFIAAITAEAECGTGSSVKIVKYSIGRLEVAFAYDPEQQPSTMIFRDEGGSLLIVDGTVYSWDRSTSSRESRFFDRSMFRKFEADPLRALRGIDAAATLIYVNARKNEIIVARDAIGNAPCYVNVEQDKVTWSPDLAAVCPEDFECRREAFDMYLASGYTLSPTSFIRQVDKLQAGTALIFSVGSGPRIKRYENYAVPPAAALSHGDVVAEMANRFPEALERRTPSSGKAGLLLSSGVDSKTILGALSQNWSGDLVAYTFEYKGYAGHLNEADDARRCAEYFGVPHHSVQVDPGVIPDRVYDHIVRFSDPVSYGLHTLVLDEVRSDGITDVFCGTGADGAWYLGSQQVGALEWSKRSPFVRRSVEASVLLAQAALEYMHEKGVAKSRRYVPLHPTVWSARTRLPRLVTALIAPSHVRRTLFSDPALPKRAEDARWSILTQALHDTCSLPSHQRFRVLQTMFYGADMMQNWNYWSARAHGLNIHAPYYDRQVLDFIWGQELLSQNKDELRSYAATMMPEEMARRGKLAQSVPIGEWLKGPLKQWVLDELSSHQGVDGGLFDRNAIQSMIEELRSNGPLPYSTAWTIWGVVMILIWMRTFTPIRGRRKHSESRQSVLIEAG